jgi:cytochrome P450
MPMYDQLVLDDINDRNSGHAAGRATVDEYPSAEEFRASMSAEIRFLPMADASHFLFDLSDEDIAAFRRAEEEAAVAANVDTIQRMLKPIASLVTKLSEYQGAKGERFHNSLIENVVDGCKLARKLALSPSAELLAEITALEESIRVRSASVIDRMFERFPERECDFVREVAALMPLQIICDMMGIPESDEEMIFNWTNTILGVGDPEYVGTFDDLVRVGGEIFSYALALGEERLKNPGDDIASIMMNAVVDGERLTAQEFGSFFILLVVAGNETTRTAIGHGMRELTIHRDQRELWFNDFDTHTKTAVEEIVRYSTPVIHFRRTATEDTAINGQPIKEGEKVVMFYQSGNRDESVFTNPNDFDIRRSAQPAQVGFGAGGPHFCLGANLARREIAVMFDEIRRRVPTLEITSEPDYLQSSFINGIKRMRCAW